MSKRTGEIGANDLRLPDELRDPLKNHLSDTRKNQKQNPLEIICQNQTNSFCMFWTCLVSDVDPKIHVLYIWVIQ